MADGEQQIKVSAKNNPFSYKKFVSKRPDSDDVIPTSSGKKVSAGSDVPFPDLEDGSMKQPLPKAGMLLIHEVVCEAC